VSAIMRLDQFSNGFIGGFFVGFRALTFKLGVAKSDESFASDRWYRLRIDVSVHSTVV
jgi:hypothetical protein